MAFDAFYKFAAWRKLLKGQWQGALVCGNPVRLDKTVVNMAHAAIVSLYVVQTSHH